MIWTADAVKRSGSSEESVGELLPSIAPDDVPVRVAVEAESPVSGAQERSPPGRRFDSLAYGILAPVVRLAQRFRRVQGSTAGCTNTITSAFT